MGVVRRGGAQITCSVKRNRLKLQLVRLVSSDLVLLCPPFLLLSHLAEEVPLLSLSPILAVASSPSRLRCVLPAHHYLSVTDLLGESSQWILALPSHDSLADLLAKFARRIRSLLMLDPPGKFSVDSCPALPGFSY
jgi:hypothetical protein